MRYRRFFDITAVTVALLFGAVYWLTPFNTDDLWYLHGTRHISDPWQALAAVWDNECEHLLYDTGRLANIATLPFLTVVPQWLYAAVQALMVWATVTLTMRMARRVAPLYRWAGLAALVFVLPWYDSMMSVVFSFNYLWSGVLMLLTAHFFAEAAAGHRYSRTAMTGILAMAVLTGWFHEGFTLPLLCAMGGMAVAARLRLPRRAWAIAAAVVAGLGVLLCFPATWRRNSEFVNLLAVIPLREAIFNVLAFNAAFYIFAASLAATLVSARLRRRWQALAPERRRLVWMCAAGAAASFAVHCLRYLGPRIAWPEILFATVGCMILWDTWAPRPSRRLTAAVAVTVAAASVANLLFAIRAERVLRDEYATIAALYDASPDGTVFYDQIRPGFTPDLLKTSARHFNAEGTIRNFSVYRCPGKPAMTLVPRALERMVWSRTPAAPSDPRVRIFAGHLVVSRDTELPTDLIMVCRAGRGWAQERIWVKDFTGADGTPLRLLNFKLFTQLNSAPVTDARL